MQERVLVRSFSCYSTFGYRLWETGRTRKPDVLDTLIDDHAPFLAKLKSQQEGFNKVFTMVGSTAQMPSQNQHKSGSRGQSYYVAEKLNAYFEGTLDKFSLIDIIRHVPLGSHFNSTMSNGDHHEYYSNWLGQAQFNKVIIVFGEALHIADQCSENAKIQFELYDGNQQRVDFLGRVFSTYPGLIPDRILLQIHHYENGEHRLAYEIHGRRPRNTEDYDYIDEIGDVCYNYFTAFADDYDYEGCMMWSGIEDYPTLWQCFYPNLIGRDHYPNFEHTKNPITADTFIRKLPFVITGLSKKEANQALTSVQALPQPPKPTVCEDSEPAPSYSQHRFYPQSEPVQDRKDFQPADLPENLSSGLTLLKAHLQVKLGESWTIEGASKMTSLKKAIGYFEGNHDQSFDTDDYHNYTTGRLGRKMKGDPECQGLIAHLVSEGLDQKPDNKCVLQ